MALYKRVPTQILIAAYHKKDGADKALEHLVEAMKDEQIVCTNIAIAKMDKKGRVRVKEMGKPGFVKGLIGGGSHGQAAGALIGGAALSILGPIGVEVGGVTGGVVGGAIGSVQGAVIGSVGKVTVQDMEKEKLKDLRSSLVPNTSALVAVFSEVVVSKHKLRSELKTEKGGVDVLVEMIDTDITAKLKAELDVAYHIVILEGGCVMSQVTQACFSADFKQVIITPDATIVNEATVTPDGAGAATTAEAVVPSPPVDEVRRSKSEEEAAVLLSKLGVSSKEEVVYSGEGVAGAAASSIAGETYFYMAEDENYELAA